ncbi:MAG TPA: LPS assembly lipoprotein LptE [Burkholderiaceae bacterium]|jgi:LPS-assembly lipoprotein|nr:LPS assembly lipoprotein LptE [Burkholderiaceae bacterium]
MLLRPRRSAAFVLLVVFAFALSACGFKLRGARELPFATIYLSSGTDTPLGAELARNLRAGTSTIVVADRGRADAVLEIVDERREREILSLNAQGRAREYTLRLRLSFRLHDGKGRELIPLTELAVVRDISYNEAQVLAKESEEALLYRDMQSDIVQQILRRLAATRPDATKG